MTPIGEHSAKEGYCSLRHASPIPFRYEPRSGQGARGAASDGLIRLESCIKSVEISRSDARGQALGLSQVIRRRAEKSQNCRVRASVSGPPSTDHHSSARPITRSAGGRYRLYFAASKRAASMRPEPNARSATYHVLMIDSRVQRVAALGDIVNRHTAMSEPEVASSRKAWATVTED